MNERFRYLPCTLHEALNAPEWADVDDNGPFTNRYLGPKREDEDLTESDIEFCRDVIDLAHPAGWDHAVRGYVAISGGVVSESACCWFAWTDAASTPAGRREALCRCVCAALGLDVNGVFPKDLA